MNKMNDTNCLRDTNEPTIDLPVDLWQVLFTDTDSELDDDHVTQEPVGPISVVKKEPVHSTNVPAMLSRGMQSGKRKVRSACASGSAGAPKRVCLDTVTRPALTTGFSESSGAGSSSSSDVWLISDADESADVEECQLPRATLFNAEPLCDTKLHDIGRYSDGMAALSSAADGAITNDSQSVAVTVKVEEQGDTVSEESDDDCGAPTGSGPCGNSTSCCWSAHQRWREKSGRGKLPHWFPCPCHPHKRWASCIECMEIRSTVRGRLMGSASRRVTLPFPLLVGMEAMMGSNFYS